MTEPNNKDKLKSMLDMVEEFDKQVDEENVKTREEMNRLLSDDRSQGRRESNVAWVWEMVKQSGVFDKFQREQNEKMIALGARIANLYFSGKSIEEISEQTNLSEEELEELLRVLD